MVGGRLTRTGFGLRTGLAELKGEGGQTTPEWALVVVFVLVLAVATFTMFNPIIVSVMQGIGSAIKNAMS